MGNVLFGYVVERQLIYENFEINLIEDNKITVSNLIHENIEELNFNQRVINLSMSYAHLLVNTHSQCYIYSFNVNKFNSFLNLQYNQKIELEYSLNI